jgi:transposase-like protein
MVLEHRGEYPPLWAAVESIALKIGCVPQTLLGWVQRHACVRATSNWKLIYVYRSG